MASLMALDGKVALITGCGHGWLPELAVSFADSGARVTVVSLDGGKPAQVQERMLGKANLILSGSVFDAGAMTDVISQAVKQLDKIDILVNSFN